MLRASLLLSLILGSTISFAAKVTPVTNDELHVFFKGARALTEGIDERATPGDQPSQEAKKVAEILNPCNVNQEQKANGTLTVLNGDSCEVTSSKNDQLVLSGVVANGTVAATAAVTGDVLKEFTGAKSSSVAQKSHYNLKVVNGQYDIVSATVDTTTTVVTTKGLTVKSSEKITYVAATSDTKAVIAVTWPGSPVLNATFHQAGDKATCTMAGKATDCAVLLYAYGYDANKGFNSGGILFK
jgi:hypothetical protein